MDEEERSDEEAEESYVASVLPPPRLIILRKQFIRSEPDYETRDEDSPALRAVRQAPCFVHEPTILISHWQGLLDWVELVGRDSMQPLALFARRVPRHSAANARIAIAAAAGE